MQSVVFFGLYPNRFSLESRVHIGSIDILCMYQLED
jgi:hypothetical protein